MLAWISVLYSEELSCQNILSQLRGCIEWLGSVRLIERPTAAYYMEELKQVDEDEVHLLFWWKVNEGKGHYGKLNCAWGALRLET